jgi:hypothetical protein
MIAAGTAEMRGHDGKRNKTAATKKAATTKKTTSKKATPKTTPKTEVDVKVKA